jgi:hypothetical protein
MQKNYDPTIDAFIEGLVQFGGHYHFDKMERSIPLISHSCSRSATGPLPGAARAAMTEEFASRRDVCVQPFLTEHRVRSRRAAGRSRATAHLYEAPPAVYEFRVQGAGASKLAVKLR